jgi:hypothetical protein
MRRCGAGGEAPRLLDVRQDTSQEHQMATSSILGADRAPTQATGRDVEALGPSDNSDSGSDVQGQLDLVDPTDTDQPIFGTVQPGLDSATDAGGTGERGAALPDEDAVDGSDIAPDHVTSIAEELQAAAGATDAELDTADLADVDELAVDDPDGVDDAEDDSDDDL